MVNQSQFFEMFGDTFRNERGWPYKKLPEVSTIVLGSTPSSSNAAFWDGDVKWITPAELSDDSFYVYDSERHITEEGVRSTSLKPFPAGTVILSTRAPIGKTAIAGCEMYCNQGFKNFICDNTINPVYLFYTLRIHNPELQKMGTGSTFLELSKKVIEQISISVPPKVLQDRFEQCYNQADKSKFAGFKSQFIEDYYNQYELSNLGAHISVIRGVSYKPADIRETGDDAVAILRSNNISDGEINYEDIVYVSPTCVSEKQFVDAGDIVMCGSNGSKKLVGKAGLIAKEQSNTSFGAFCLGIRCKKTLAPEYLNAYFNSRMYRSIIEELGNGTNIINIRPDHITSLSIPVPEKDVQNEFVVLSRQADKSKYLN